MDIPIKEIDHFFTNLSNHPEYLDTKSILNSYLSYDLQVIPDPYSKKIIKIIISSLENNSPLSVIRIGDGEANILSYGSYPDTPYLNVFSFKKIINMQQDRFKLEPEWMLYLQSIMLSSVLQSDIIGVIGLWRPGTPCIPSLKTKFINDPRGISGHWRAIDHLLDLASQGYFKSKYIASAHLYFSILDNLSVLFKYPKKVFIINDLQSITSSLENKFPQTDFEFIQVGSRSSNNNILISPCFLHALYEKLPIDMKGTLSLVGAGPWSEIYCSWIKQRGGVAIDLGSGFNLLNGDILRPVHKLLKLETYNPYKVI